MTIRNSTSVAYVASQILADRPAALYGISGYNSKNAPQFIQLHDAVTLPADTAVPAVMFQVPALSPFSIDYGVNGRLFGNGVVVCNSSTGPTKTIGAADCWFDAQIL